MARVSKWQEKSDLKRRRVRVTIWFVGIRWILRHFVLNFSHISCAFIFCYLFYWCILVFTHNMSARLALLLCQFVVNHHFLLKYLKRTQSYVKSVTEWGRACVCVQPQHQCGIDGMNDIRQPTNKMRIFARHKINKYRFKECFFSRSLRFPFRFFFTPMITIIMLWMEWESRINALAP